MSASLLDSLRSLSIDEKKRLLQRRFPNLPDLPNDDAAALLYDWRGVWARPSQIPPQGDWRYWLILTGRGWGKTRTGAEWIREEAKTVEYANIIGATADDARDIMILGESGILAVCPSWERPRYVKGERRLDWPNGAQTLIFTADEPERLRGKQHQRLWADEIASWRYGQDAWEQAELGLRLPGQSVKAVLTTTPKPRRIVQQVIQHPNCIVTRGTSYENRENLDPHWFAEVIKRHEGTRLGRQELLGELLEDVPGALWIRSRIDELRVRQAPTLRRVIVGVDPAVSTVEDASDTGIVAAGVDDKGDGYVLYDATCHETPKGWAGRAIWLYYELKADRVVGEVNNGGQMVAHTLHTLDNRVAFREVRASRGKYIRAEPIAALYEQGRIHHVGTFDQLEDQMVSFTPDYDGRADRVDALVWALTELMLGGPGERPQLSGTYRSPYA